jgi:anti-sigma factor RsiW
MACEPWNTKLSAYLDGELSEEEMRSVHAHVRSCASCSADALERVQMKRAIQVAGKRYPATAEFRRRIQQSVAPAPEFRFRLGWLLAAATALSVLVAGLVAYNYAGSRTSQNQVFSEIADLHVATLASSSPVDVVSTDRHTVKPWFQGKIPFAFNLPEVANSEFTLVGGRMTYLEQTPGAHLIYDVRKHHISVFIFPEDGLRAHLGGKSAAATKTLFNVETWHQNGLRYFVIGDASAADIDRLVRLFEAA